MLVNSDFRSGKDGREILPMERTALPYVCMYRDMNGSVGRECPGHWHTEFEIDYVTEGKLEYSTPDRTGHDG